MSRELLKREMKNYSHLWKNKENNIKRNISQVISIKRRNEWTIPLLMKEAKDEVVKDKQKRAKRIISKMQAISKMNLLGYVSQAVNDRRGDEESHLRLRQVKEVLM